MRYVELVLALLGTAASLVAGVLVLRSGRALAGRAVRVEALVESVRESDGGAGGGNTSPVRLPLLRFTTEDGAEIRTESPHGISPALNGRRVTVFHDRDDPRHILSHSPPGRTVAAGTALIVVSASLLGWIVALWP